jgi:purine-cytosine permease-like protein
MAIASANAYLNGTPGAKHHLGYGMLARAAFGMWGSYFCIMLNVFQSFVFYVSLRLSRVGKSIANIFREHKCTLAAKHLSSF